MVYYPVIIVLILAVLDWIAADRKIKALEYFAKPATMIALLWWLWQNTGLGGSMLWFTIGVIFCLAGDIVLMLPRDMLIFGLLAFLLGQVSYILGLNNVPPLTNIMGLFLLFVLQKWLAFVVAIVLIIYVAWLYPKFARSLAKAGKNTLRFPVLIYSLVFSFMVFSAFMTWYRAGWVPAAALSASVGALLFLISDSILGWDRFITPLSHARLKTMITYHLAQIGIILGAMLSSTGK